MPVIAISVGGKVPFGHVNLDVGIFGFPDNLAAPFEEFLVRIRVLDKIRGKRDAIVIVRRKNVEKLAGIFDDSRIPVAIRLLVAFTRTCVVAVAARD